MHVAKIKSYKFTYYLNTKINIQLIRNYTIEKDKFSETNIKVNLSYI